MPTTSVSTPGVMSSVAPTSTSSPDVMPSSGTRSSAIARCHSCRTRSPSRLASHAPSIAVPTTKPIVGQKPSALPTRRSNHSSTKGTTRKSAVKIRNTQDP